MPERLLVLSALLLGTGSSLLLSLFPWFSRRPLADRVRPHLTGDNSAPKQGPLSWASLREVLEPFSRTFGERLAGVFGVTEDLATRLRRVHASDSVSSFRLRQLGVMAAASAVGAVSAAAAGPPPLLALLLVLGSPILGFLVVEQALAQRSQRWQARVHLELPVFAEQLALLVSAGYSLGAAISRVANRGSGSIATDLRIVNDRVRQGLSEADALTEWAALVRVPSVERLVAVLSLHRHATDLGRLLSEEARAARRDVQRETIEVMERRAQLVWVPVTVATLVPGVIFLAIPFIEALRLFSGG